MKNKKYLLIALLSLGGISYSQIVDIRLSIEWGENSCVLERDMDSIPYLSVTYTNNTEKDIYFRNLSETDCGYPSFYSSILMNIPKETYYNKKFRAKLSPMATPRHYYVEISGAALWLQDDSLFCIMNCTQYDSVDMGIDVDEHLVNFELDDFYEYERMVCCGCSKSEIGSNMEKARHYYMLDEEEIMYAYGDFFVFLRKGESHTERMNLIGFMKLGGEYDFYMNGGCKMSEDVVSDVPFYDKIDKEGLPETVSGYSLYNGQFVANHIFVNFSADSENIGQ